MSVHEVISSHSHYGSSLPLSKVYRLSSTRNGSLSRPSISQDLKFRETLTSHQHQPHLFQNCSPLIMEMGPPEHDMEHFQRLSDQYQPDVQGPLIGRKTPITVLMTEYAHADPTYVTKIAGLIATNSDYRPIKGDGQCGWRAVVFGYFEILLELQDLQLVSREIGRLGGFSDTLRHAGYDMDMVGMFAEETMELVEKIRQAVQTRDTDDSFLLEAMNDEQTSNSIVFHFKLMTSAYMQLNAYNYEPFLEMSMQDYRASHIDAHAQEIEQVGMQGLTDGVLAPGGITIEVLYLDRSVGDEVTPHMFVQNAETWPTIRLLYRPGHYDMIYRSQQQIQVHLNQHHESPEHHLVPTNDMYADMETMSHFFPNASLFTQPTQPSMPFYVPSHQQYPTQQSTYDDQYPSYNSHAYDSTYSPTHEAPQPILEAPAVNAPAPVTPTTVSTVTTPFPIDQRPQQPFALRYTAPYYKLGRYPHESVPLETGPFRDSPFNQAHFLNSDFQPQIWKAEEEYMKP